MSQLIDKVIFAIKLLNDYFFPIIPTIKLDSSATLGNYGASFTIDEKRINSESIVYSFGVGFDISFDLALIARYHTKIYSFDPTPQSSQWIRQQKLPKEFIFEELGVSDHDGQATFFPPENPNHISHTMVPGIKKGEGSFSVKVERLASIMKRHNHKKIDLLKMDIEGAEYAVIDDLLKDMLPIEQIAVEFHHRFKGFRIQETKYAVNKLEKAGYRLFAISSSGEEFSFIKNFD